jgi:hypothetical protein
VSFAAITVCVASQRVFVVYFVIDLVRKLLDATIVFIQSSSTVCNTHCQIILLKSFFFFIVSLQHVITGFRCGQVLMITSLNQNSSSCLLMSYSLYMNGEITSKFCKTGSGARVKTDNSYMCSGRTNYMEQSPS